MANLRVDWNLPSPASIPERIRSAVERHLAVLWQFLDCSFARAAIASGAACRSEEFALQVEQWVFGYEIDVASGTAVVRHADVALSATP